MAEEEEERAAPPLGSSSSHGSGVGAASVSGGLLPSMPTPKMLCLIRHGQGEHNPRNNKLALAFLPAMLKRDAPLTTKGRRQAGALRRPLHDLPFQVVSRHLRLVLVISY